MTERGCVVVQEAGKTIASADWREVTLGDVVHLHTEQVNPAHYPGRLFRHFSIPAFDENHAPAEELDAEIGSNKFTVPADSILVSRLNPRIPRVWEPTVEDGDFAIASTEFLVLLPRGIDRRFLKYLCLDPKMRSGLEGMVTGTSGSHQRVRPRDVLNIRIPLPPLPEQRAIAHVLGTLDDKIELNRRMNETLEEMARALFKSWFVDFEPVRAKIEGRWRPGESLPGLPAEHYDLFPDRLVDSELGEVPEGWEVKSIEAMAERVAMGPFGSSIKVSTFVDAGVPVISGQHLNGIFLDDNEYRFITEEHAEKLANANVQRGDVIFTHAGSIGQAAYIPVTSRFERYVISQRQFYMRCDLSKISPLFVVHFFKTREGQHQLLANTSSTGVPSIARPVTYLRSIRLCVPPKALWSLFHDIASGFHVAIGRNTTECGSLAAQRDALLPKLVSGEMGWEIGQVRSQERIEK